VFVCERACSILQAILSARGNQPARRGFALLAAIFIFAVPIFAQESDYAIAHVTIINPDHGKPRPDMTIVVRGHVLLTVVPANQFKAQPSMKIIDERGMYVIPGLWDMHVHFRDAQRDLKMLREAIVSAEKDKSAQH
jgi:imidazolonepropionase-like amidohydrolase